MPDASPPCPGLSGTAAGMVWRNSIGQVFDLATEKKHTPGEVATQMRRSSEWVLRKVREKQLYPVVQHNERFVEIYACAIADYYHRHTKGNGNHAAA